MTKRRTGLQCSKRKYPTRDAAEGVVRGLLRAREGRPAKFRAGFLKAYLCEFCGVWHVGHTNSQEGLVILIDKVVAADKKKREAAQ